MKKILLFTIVVIFNFQSGFSQIGTNFWFVAPEVTESGNHDRPIWLRMTTTGAAATVTIAQPAQLAGIGLGTPLVISIPANSTVSQDLSVWIDQIESGIFNHNNHNDNAIEKKGIHITSTSEISCYYEVTGMDIGNPDPAWRTQIWNSDIFTLKGAMALGTNFYTPFQNSLPNAFDGWSAFHIVATEDNTTITITPTKAIVGHAAGVPYTIILNTGETYCGRATGQAGVDHPGGTHITSDKPIAVTTKDDSIQQNGASDLAGDQIVPVNILGTDYIVIKGFVNTSGANLGDRAIVCATQNGTVVKANGSTIATLNAGEQFNYQVVLQSEYIQTSFPAYVFHLSGFGDELGGAILPTIKCTGSTTVSFTRDTDEPFYLNILVKTINTNKFTLNGAASPSITPAAFSIVPNTPVAGEWSIARVLFSTTDIIVGNPYTVANSGGLFHLGVINGQATNAGCRYGYFSDYGTSAVELGSDVTICSGQSHTFDIGPGWTNIFWNGVASVSSTFTTSTAGIVNVSAEKAGCVGNPSVLLKVNSLPAITLQPNPSIICEGLNASFQVGVSGKDSTIQWEVSTDNGLNYLSVTDAGVYSGAKKATLNITAAPFAMNGYKYRSIVSGTCAPAVISNAELLTVNTVPKIVSQPVDARVCQSADATFSVSATGSSLTYQWQEKTSAGVFTNLSNNAKYTGTDAATLQVKAAGTSINNNLYRCIITGACPPVLTTNTVKLEVDPTTAAGTISNDTTVCTGVNSGQIRLIGNVGSILNWESSTDNFVTVSTLNNTLNAQGFTNISQATKFRAVLQSGVCNVVTSATALVQVDQKSVGGSVTADASVCKGSNSGTITLNGNTGSIVSWESSTDNFATVTAINNTLNTQSYLNINVTTKYRALIKSGVCNSVTSGAATIKVDPSSAGGIVSADSAVCTGTNSGTVRLSGYVGSIVKWESSTDNFATVTTINNTLSTQAFTDLTLTTKYRAVVQSAGCGTATSATATIQVDQKSTGGNVTGDISVCKGTNAGTVTLNGNTGNIIKWESSTDNFTTVTTINNTLNTQGFTDLNLSTKFRAVVQSGSCASANSGPATIQVDPNNIGGNITGSATVCPGNNSGVLKLTGNTGSIVEWESSTDNFVTSQKIANSTDSLAYLNISADTKYRVLVKSGICPSAISATASVTLGAGSAGGITSGDATVCTGNNSGTIQLSNQTGNVINWESSTDNFLTIKQENNNTTTFSYLNLSTTTQYRAISQSGTCPKSVSTIAKVTVNNVTVSGSVGNDTTVCASGNQGSLVLKDYQGSILRWERSTDNFTTYDTIPNQTASNPFLNLVTTTSYRAVVKASVCTASASLVAKVTVNQVSSAGVAAPAKSPLCENSATSVSLTGANGTIIWQQSSDSVNWSVVPGISATLTTPSLNSSVYYRAIVKNGLACAADTSKKVYIKVDKSTDAGTIAAALPVCVNGNVTLKLSGNTGKVTWLQSTDGIQAWINVTGGTGANGNNYNTPVLTGPLYYTALVQNGICPADTSNKVQVKPDPLSHAGLISANDTLICPDGFATIQLNTAPSGKIQWQKSNDNIVWANIAGANTLNYTTPNSNQTGYYRVIATSGVCASDSSKSVSVTVKHPAEFNLGKDTMLCESSFFQLKAPEGFKNYLWSNNSSDLHLNILAKGTYSLKAIDMNTNCPVMDTILVAGCDRVIIPNIITPLGTTPGYNDYFVILGNEPDSKIEIFNRWGSLVYQSDNYLNNWDAMNVSDGVYYYIYQNGGDSKKYTGYVEVLR